MARKIACTSSVTCGPLARTTAIAEVPTGVARAAMVSPEVDIRLTQAKRVLKAKAKSGPRRDEFGREL